MKAKDEKMSVEHCQHFCFPHARRINACAEGDSCSNSSTRLPGAVANSQDSVLIHSSLHERGVLYNQSLYSERCSFYQVERSVARMTGRGHLRCCTTEGWL